MYVTMVTVATTSKSGLTLFIEKIPIFPYTLGKRIVFFSLPEALCGLKYAEKRMHARMQHLDCRRGGGRGGKGNKCVGEVGRIQTSGLNSLRSTVDR